MSAALSEVAGTYTRQTEVAQGADSCTRIEEEVGWFHVAVDDTARVDVAQCPKHTSEIRSNAVHGYVFEEVL